MPSRTSGGTPGGDSLQHVLLFAHYKNNPTGAALGAVPPLHHVCSCRQMVTTCSKVPLLSGVHCCFKPVAPSPAPSLPPFPLPPASSLLPLHLPPNNHRAPDNPDGHVAFAVAENRLNNDMLLVRAPAAAV